ncbi:MAG: hypothetical protein KKI08_07355, partial [Armatimonadetes bacterium]|nr:hypothetical protein [Armatimonadota bacterium]
MDAMPNIWGGGQLFAFSGLEGETSWEHPLVGSLLPDRVGLDFHQSPPVVLEIVPDAPGEITPEFVLNDAFSLQVGAAPVLVACADRFTIIGRMGDGLGVRLRDAAYEIETKAGHVALMRDGGQWAL